MLETLIRGDVFLFACQLIVLLSAFAYHEFAHAIVADYLGDPTPRKHGRISLNPVVHLDPLGTFLLLILGFGWAVTPITPHYLRGNMRHSMAWVAVAGPAANLFMAILFAIPLRLVDFGLLPWDWFFLPGGYLTNVAMFFAIGVQLNIFLLCFNLLPIPPLDGFTILQGLLPNELAYKLDPIRQYGPIFLMVLLIMPRTMGFSVINLINPTVNFLFELLTNLVLF